MKSNSVSSALLDQVEVLVPTSSVERSNAVMRSMRRRLGGLSGVALTAPGQPINNALDRRGASPAITAAATTHSQDMVGDDTSDARELSGQEGSAARHIRLREQARVRAILTSGEAQANYAMALQIACHSSMPRDQAIEALRVAAELASMPVNSRADRQWDRSLVKAQGRNRNSTSGNAKLNESERAWDSALASAKRLG